MSVSMDFLMQIREEIEKLELLPLSSRQRLLIFERQAEARKLLYTLCDSRYEQILEAIYMGPGEKGLKEIAKVLDITVKQAQILHDEAISWLDSNMTLTIKQNIKSMIDS